MAVIVILAIIALIAVPIILNIIGSSKKSAVLRSGELYLKAVETTIARENLKTQYNPSSCVIEVDGNLKCTDKDNNETKLIVEVNGSKPTAGTIELTKGKITSVTEMILDGKELKKENGKVTIVGDPAKDPKDTLVVDLPEGLTPVIYSDNNWKVADTTLSWYNYDNQEWANAVILNSGITKNVGDIIDVSNEIKGMFVYIPRYEYKIEGQYGKHSDGTEGTKDQPGEIKVNFIGKDKIVASGGYILHPAFTFGTEQLPGIWVGKFETTGTAEIPTILPSALSLQNQKVSAQFTTARIFKTYLNNDNIDFHMAKNSEWGAVAYLSQSKYGKYGNNNYIGIEKQVMINNCKNFITGVGADEQNAKNTDTTCTTNTYETSKGQAASTTGNITGVYDMSGGSFEYVMGVLSAENGNPLSGYDTINSGFNGKLGNDKEYTEGIDFPASKYYDLYTTKDPYDFAPSLFGTACNNGICYGHGLSETSGWYNNSSDFIMILTPWFLRGDGSNIKNAGVFSTGMANGDSYDGTTFRIILVES